MATSRMPPAPRNTLANHLHATQPVGSREVKGEGERGREREREEREGGVSKNHGKLRDVAAR